MVPGIGINILIVKSITQLDRPIAFLTELVKALMSAPVSKHLPLVLHIREGDNCWWASTMFITVLKDAGVPQKHRVYCYSFLGDQQEPEDWKWAFSNVMFEVCLLSLLDPAVKQFFIRVDWDWLLVETDASYQPKVICDQIFPSVHVTSPFHMARHKEREYTCPWYWPGFS